MGKWPTGTSASRALRFVAEGVTVRCYTHISQTESRLSLGSHTSTMDTARQHL
jgi:hypothetical protein